MAYTMEDYRDMVGDMHGSAHQSSDYQLAKMNSLSILGMLMHQKETSQEAAWEAGDLIAELFDKGAQWNDPDVQHLVWLLKETGYDFIVYDMMDWDWAV